MSGRSHLGGLLLLSLVLLLPGRGLGGEADLPPAWHGILAETADVTDPGERVVRLSAPFLGVPYRANTLGGGAGQPERLVAVLDGVDCFTLLDYVEALRRSATPGDFPGRLAEVRYRGSRVSWAQRRHFFTDWARAAEQRVADVTAEVGGAATRQVVKRLNEKGDGGRHLAGVKIQERPVHFIPAEHIDAAVLARLQSGDYLGIYTPEAGLDVSHVGIVVRTDGRLLLRHASSRRDVGRVVDSDLAAYLADRPGIVVLRPRPGRS